MAKKKLKEHGVRRLQMATDPPSTTPLPLPTRTEINPTEVTHGTRGVTTTTVQAPRLRFEDELVFCEDRRVTGPPITVERHGVKVESESGPAVSK